MGYAHSSQGILNLKVKVVGEELGLGLDWGQFIWYVIRQFTTTLACDMMFLRQTAAQMNSIRKMPIGP